jgi:hypothetical protein
MPNQSDFETEWANLIKAGSYIIYKMSKNGERDFYFDSTDLPQCKDKFLKKRQAGWGIAGEAFTGLSHRLPERTSDIKALDLELFEWGYQKKLNS